MSHLHLPDGVLPAWVWGPGLLAALALLVLTARSLGPREIAWQGAIGGLVLAAMAVPLGPLEYHLTLAAPMGVLLGAAGGFQVAFVVSAILALMGHGGLTTVGLNALVLGATAALARPCFEILRRACSPPWAMAWSTAVAQVAAGVVWLGVVAAGLMPAADAHGHESGRTALVAGIAVPLWLMGTAIEALVAYGIARFLTRVHPALLPAPRPEAA